MDHVNRKQRDRILQQGKHMELMGRQLYSKIKIGDKLEVLDSIAGWKA